MKGTITLACLLLLNTVFAQQIFHNLPSFLEYAETKSISLKNSTIKEQQAKKAKIAAIVGVADPQFMINGTFVNNTKLPVTVLPADVFGGQSGTTKEVEMGTSYVTSFQPNLDIKLINFEGLKNLKLSKINIEITETDSKLIKKNFYENIAIAYYNIVQLQEQQKSTQKNIVVSDSLLKIVQNKYNAGLVKQQDVNDSKVNLLTIQENEKQITFLIQQNYLSLKILADIPENEAIVIDEKIDDLPFSKPEIEKNNLLVSSFLLKEQYAMNDYGKNKQSRLPTLSLVKNNSFNQYNQNFTITGGNWVPSSYIGLKLSIPMPSSKTISNKSNAMYNYELAQQNSNQATIKADLDYQKMDVEWEKAQSLVKNYTEIFVLLKDTYTKNKNLYTEGLQSIDRTLNSLNTLVNAEYNVINSKVNVLLSQAKIKINNEIK
ncbi:MAG: TolC family protein [Prolixibacteraceae bacterium]|nr:TolC family protein [Prolixibacteraceae bacterium]